MNGNDFASTSISATTTVSGATLRSPTPPIAIQRDVNVEWIDGSDSNFSSSSIKDIYNEPDRYYPSESQSAPSSVVSSSCAASITNEFSNLDSNFHTEDDQDVKGPGLTIPRSASSDSQPFTKRRSRRKEPISEQRKFNIALAKKLSPIAKYKEQMKKVKAKRNQRRKFSLIHSFEACGSTRRTYSTERSPVRNVYFVQPSPSPTQLQPPTLGAVTSIIPLPQPSAFYPPQQLYIMDDPTTSINPFSQDVITYQAQIAPAVTFNSECSTSTLANPNANSQMKNERSILSGRMSRELVKEISEYVYNLLKGQPDKVEELVAHSPYYKQKKIDDSSLDYKDYVEMMDEKKPSRSPISLNKPVAFVKQYNRQQNSRMKYRYGVSRRYTKSTLPSQIKRRSFSRFRRLHQ